MAAQRRSADNDGQRQHKLDALHERLQREVQALVSGEDWRRWLQVASRFHTYSFRNTVLILAQRPEATAVAGYEAWRTLGRQVNKGERGIQVLAPVLRRTAKTADGEQASEDVHSMRRRAGFRLAHVWDLSQTSGTPLPVQPKPVLLTGQAPNGLWDALVTVATDAGFSVDRADCRTANGYTDFAAREIRVRADVDDAQACKTLAHEIGHLSMHDTAAFNGTTAGCCGVAEVEAESLAYLVTASHALDASGYTFAYVASWAGTVNGSEPHAVVRATGQRVMTAAHSVLSRTQPAGPPAADAVLAARADAGLERAGEVRRLAKSTVAQLATPVDRLFAIHREATAFFSAQLDGSWVPGYLAGRGLGSILKPASPWGVGYAPASWTALTDHLRRNGYAEASIESSGLALLSSSGRLIDRFRDRAMLPVREPHGAVIAFIGRAHPDVGDNMPRYLNSPETALYRKSEVLYGLAEASASLAAGGRPVLVEGALDAIAITDGTAGRCVGLSPCGTALTAGQVETLRSAIAGTEPRLVVAFDGDPGGHASMLRSYDLLKGLATHALAANLGNGQDPASILAREGPAALTEALDNPQRLCPLVDVVIDDRIGRWASQLMFPEGQLGALRSVAPLIAALPPDTISRHVTQLADRLGLDHATITREVAVSLDGSHVVAASTLARQNYPQPYRVAAHCQAASAPARPAAHPRSGAPGPTPPRRHSSSP